MVSAFDCILGVVLAQMKTDEKSNEIKTMPELLALLSLKGSLVSIDAMGAQVKITEVIRDQGGDYLIGLKDNQPTFHEETVALFDALSSQAREPADEASLPAVDHDEQTDGGHGRIEVRRATVCSDFSAWVPSAARFADVRTLIEIEATRIEKSTGKTSDEKRYYFSSRELSAMEAIQAVRGHWAIENQLHWCLDESFDEDRCRVRVGNAAENFALVRHFAINVVRSFAGDKLSIPRRRQKCDYYAAYREKLLGIS